MCFSRSSVSDEHTMGPSMYVCRVFRGGTQPAWPEVNAPTGLLNLHDWRVTVPWGYSIGMTWDERMTKETTMTSNHICATTTYVCVTLRTPLEFQCSTPKSTSSQSCHNHHQHFRIFEIHSTLGSGNWSHFQVGLNCSKLYFIIMIIIKLLSLLLIAGALCGRARMAPSLKLPVAIFFSCGSTVLFWPWPPHI
jgi:hypothetical protein